MRKITHIIVHCSAGSQKSTAADIVAYHTSPVSKGGRGWSAPGYHYIVEPDGNVVCTWPEEKISNGVKGLNHCAINVCYIGGVDTSKKGLPPIDNRTPQQRAAIADLLSKLICKYPGARIFGHRDFATKACPSFDAKEEYSYLCTNS